MENPKIGDNVQVDIYKGKVVGIKTRSGNNVPYKFPLYYIYINKRNVLPFNGIQAFTPPDKHIFTLPFFRDEFTILNED